MTTDTFIKPPVTTNAPRKKTDVANERQISSDILTEIIKGFNRFMPQSTIKNSEDDHTNKIFSKSDPKSDPLVATHTSDRNERKITDTDTTKGNSPHKLLMSREIPAIIQGVILLVNQMTMDRVATSGWTLYVVHAVLHKEIVTGATRSAAGVLKDTPVVNWKKNNGTIPRDRNTVGMTPRANTQVSTGTGTYSPPNYHSKPED